MTHLKIELNTNNTEYVSSDIIKKLYDIVRNNTLDSNSNIVGSIQAPLTYREYKAYLESRFPDLHISTNENKYYKSFLDPNVEKAVAEIWGDGTGILESRFENLTNTELGTHYWEPLTGRQMTWFDELKDARYITSIWSNTFQNTGIYWVNLSNVTEVKSQAFVECPNVCSKIFARCNNITSLGNLMVRSGNFENYTVVMPPNLAQYPSMFCSYSNTRHVYFQNNTPPTFVKQGAFDNCTFHVPTGCISAYQLAILDAGYDNTNFITFVEYDWQTDPDGWLDPVVIPSSL